MRTWAGRYGSVWRVYALSSARRYSLPEHGAGKEVNRMYFNECKYCGATLDPGEKCDCQTVQDTETKKELAPVGERERKQDN